MYKQGQYRISWFARNCGVTVKTVQRWDNENIVPARRTDTDRRYYTEEDVELVEHLKTEPKKKHLR